jgi:putative endopeptidase
MFLRTLVLAALIANTTAALAAQQPAAAPSSDTAQGTAPVVHGIDRADLDTTCAACQDFYQFAIGGWRARNPVPAAFADWGTLNVLQVHNRVTVRQVLDEAARDTSVMSGGGEQRDIRKLGMFYATCMDSAAAESRGLSPIAPELARIAAIDGLPALREEAAHLQARGTHVMFTIGSRQDAKNSSEMILSVSQGGLGLPDRDYYLKTDSAAVAIRTAYAAYAARILTLAGDDSSAAAAEAARVMTLETELAQIAHPNTEQQNPYAVYHRMSLAAGDRLSPHIAWSTWLRDAGAPGVASFNVAEPGFFQSLDTLLVTTPVADWRVYLRWHVLDATDAWLSSRFAAEGFRMDSVLNGATEMLPRWQRCAGATDGAMGDALGRAYVARTFSPEAKARALAMVRNMESVLRSDLATLAWMSPATRRQAIAKLDAFENKIGYPDKWRDYSGLDIRRQGFVENLLSANAFEFARRVHLAGHPADRTEWTMSPPTVNAYYSATNNEVVFPAGVLQPPLFDPDAPDAVNYGGIGAGIGHEMTHGFDDEGRQYDARGNLRDWWTAADAKSFADRARSVVEQFGAYTVNDSLHVNGKLTQDENIADLGGLKIAYAALERSLAGKPRHSSAGFTPEQQFFLSWARIWATTTRPELARRLVLTDPHAPNRWRVNGPLSNMPEFAAAFGCQARDPMVRPPAARVAIW